MTTEGCYVYISVWPSSSQSPLASNELFLSGLASNTYLYLKTQFCVFVIELKISKGHAFVIVFDIWSVFIKYLQIQSNTHF